MEERLMYAKHSAQVQKTFKHTLQLGKMMR